MIKRLFSPPQFENDQDNFRAKFINGFAWIVIALLIVALIPYLIRIRVNFNYTIFVLLGLIAVLFAAIILLRRGSLNISGVTLVVLFWLGISVQALTADGVKDVIVVAYIAIALLASIVISWRAGGFVIVASIVSVWALALLEVNQVIVPSFQQPTAFAGDLSIIFLAITALIFFSTTGLRDAINRASKSEEKLRASNQSLQELNQTLEERVASRTGELEIANRRNERRAKQFEAIAQVARAAASIQDEETLLSRLAYVISAQFGFYHTGIFLIDDKREYAVLRATNSEGGKRMLDRGHRLKIGQIGIVGYVTASGNSRIALDVGADAAFFDNPDLPNTRSELALPIRVGDEIIGALDVQSTEANAFQQEDTEVLVTLADQIAIAIQNSLSFERTQELLSDAQKVSGSYLKESWRTLQPEQERIGYIVSKDNLRPLDKPITSAQINKAIKDKVTVAESGKTATLAIPIRLRDEVVGVIDIQAPDEHDWDPDEVDIAEAVAERLSLAIETSLLLQTTRRRAEIESLTADISDKISSTTQFDTILRTAAEELSRVLGGSEVLVQIQAESLEKSFDSQEA